MTADRKRNERENLGYDKGDQILAILKVAVIYYTK